MWKQEIYLEAMNFAAKAHGDQKVPDSNNSYLAHLACVAMEVMTATCDDPEVNHDLAVQCALLHDTVEDTKVTYEDIRARFGVNVANGVHALTKNKKLEKPLQMKDSLKRILLQPREIHMVKMADRITNLQKPPSSWNAEKKEKYQEDAKLIYELLKESNSNLAERLLTKINAYDVSG